MSTKYKFRDQGKLYFVSFSVVNWIDLFIRNEYKNIILESWKHCQKYKGLEIYGWCIMSSHIRVLARVCSVSQSAKATRAPRLGSQNAMFATSQATQYHVQPAAGKSSQLAPIPHQNKNAFLRVYLSAQLLKPKRNPFARCRFPSIIQAGPN
jgi:REP element-mobilizing transposase RayT